jgi:NTE family protein
MVGLESGKLRYCTESGEVLERDGRTPVRDHSAVPAACVSLAQTTETLEGQLHTLQRQLAAAPPGEKSRLVVHIRLVQEELRSARRRLDECARAQSADPLTVDLIAGVLASASIPGVFPPVTLGGETYVDGGVREILPVQIAVDLGATEIYAVSTSPAELRADERTFANALLPVIMERSVADILLDEITIDDARPQVEPNREVPTVFLIQPDTEIELHSTTTIDPGLIQISRDYGYMRAADVVDMAARESRRWRTSTEIAAMRVNIWATENRVAGQADPREPAGGIRAPAPELQAEVDAAKATLRGLIAARRADSGPMPTDIDWYAVSNELHPWVGAVHNRGFALQGVRVAVLQALPRESNVFLVKDAPEWSQLSGDLDAFALEGDRVAVLQRRPDGGNTFFVKQGPLDAPWSQLSGDLDAFALEGDRVAISQRRASGSNALFVKFGSLDAEWSGLFAVVRRP